MLETALAIAGVLITWLTYTKTFHSKPTEEIENFVVQYRATQTTSKRVHAKLVEYALKNDAFDLDMFPGITYRKYIVSMEESYKENLSDELMQKIYTEGLSKSIILSMTKSIEAQLNALIMIETEINIRLK